jgi:hypothetical protein
MIDIFINIKNVSFDLYCKIKYFVFFIMFLNSIFVNYLYYKCFNKTSNNLIVILSYSINLNGCIIIKLIQWINNQLFFLKNINDNNKFINQIFSQYYENCYIHNLNYTKSLFYTEFVPKTPKPRFLSNSDERIVFLIIK